MKSAGAFGWTDGNCNSYSSRKVFSLKFFKGLILVAALLAASRDATCLSLGCPEPGPAQNFRYLVAERESVVALEQSNDTLLTAMTRTLILRLKPAEDTKLELQRLCDQHQLKAACVVTCVGSLTTMKLRLANQPVGSEFAGPLEIVSLVGTLSQNGSHLHLCACDCTGKATGGHLMDGCLVYTTAEIVIGVFDGAEFQQLLISNQARKSCKLFLANTPRSADFCGISC